MGVPGGIPFLAVPKTREEETTIRVVALKTRDWIPEMAEMPEATTVMQARRVVTRVRPMWKNGRWMRVATERRTGETRQTK
jgi:hypothetical protein